MELEVRRVGGMETCFVSLPLSFIQTLQQSSRFSHSNLPPILSLQLRPSSLTSTSTNINTNPPRLWHLAWSGSASRSNAIEVAPQLAECIGLPDHTKVEVKVLANLPKATTISIEPLSVDDWEILELNSQLAEETILKQVGIVHAEMKFPLWLEGHVIVLFLVVSTSPKEPVVQLVPGTEVLVAPKRRQSNLHSSSSEDALEEHIPAWGKLRVQDFDRSLIVRSNLKSVKLDIIPTVFVFVNRDTVRALGYSEYQLVTIMSRENGDPLSFKDSYNLSKTDEIRKENVGSLFSVSLASRHFIGLLCLSNLVAHGHVMLPWSLRAYLGAKLHSWVYVREHKLTPGGTVESLILSPYRCELPKRDMRHGRNDQEKFHHQVDFKSGKLSYKKDHFVNESTTIHDGLLGVLSQAFDKLQNEENLSKNNGEAYLFLAWVVAQLDAMDIRTEEDKNSVVLGRQTLLHFEVDDAQKYRSDPTDKALSSLSNVTKDQDSIGLLFLLTANFEDKSQKSYKFTLSKGISANHENTEFDVLPQRLVLGSPFSFNYIEDKVSEISSGPPLSSLHWMATPASEVLNRLSMLISPISGKIIGTLNLPIPGHVLLYGPSGSGKTILASALAKHFQEHKDILAHVCFVSCSKLGVEKPHSVKQGVANAISEALNHAPSLLVLDDLDSILLSSSEEGAQESSATVVLAEYVADIIDECQDKRKNNCGVGPIAFMATAHSLDKLPLCLRSSGRFDFHIQLSAPAASERRAILKYEINKRSLSCHDDALADVSSKCDGYDGYDLNILIDRAVHAAASRFVLRPLPEKPIIEREDFMQAMTDFVPIAMRGITKATSENRTGWEDVGGLTNIKNTIQEIIEIPAKFPNIFKHAPLRLRSNVLLYGPPGCGKTHIVGAAAAAYSLRFISIKGPELLNKYIGASEQAVRDIFAKATSAAPCLLFFDEFDSIAPKRGHDNTGVTDRVVNQFLTELDGVEVLTGVYVFAATSRPDLLDAALLRPGRLDRLLFCDFPSKHDRLDIFKVLSRKLPMASDVDLETVATLTEGFTGADIQALLSDAQLEAVHKVLASKDGAVLGKPSIIDNAVLKSVTTRARPSVSPSERQRLYGIYNQFLDSKKPVATEARDAKGKKATLA